MGEKEKDITTSTDGNDGAVMDTTAENTIQNDAGDDQMVMDEVCGIKNESQVEGTDEADVGEEDSMTVEVQYVAEAEESDAEVPELPMDVGNEFGELVEYIHGEVEIRPGLVTLEQCADINLANFEDWELDNEIMELMSPRFQINDVAEYVLSDIAGLS